LQHGEGSPSSPHSAAPERPRFSDYRDAVLAMVADVIRIKFQGKSSSQHEEKKE